MPEDATSTQVIYVQNSVHLAGAQKSLSRILSSPEIQKLAPILVTSKEGWLTTYARTFGIQVFSPHFPKSRSLPGRLFANRLFGKNLAGKLNNYLVSEARLIVHANDHPDSILGYRLAQSLDAKSVLTLRTPGMTKRDFFKYGCDRHDVIISVGDALFESAQEWFPAGNHMKVYNGVLPDEFYSSVPIKPGESIEKVLVLGSTSPRKGWQDLVEALLIIEKSGEIESFPQIVFLGDQYGKDPKELFSTDRLKKFKLLFLDPVENYAETIRSFPLVIHPSRSESFGMSVLETVAAGTPILAAATGMIPEFIKNKNFLYPPGETDYLAKSMIRLLKQDQASIMADFELEQIHAKIKRDFSTNKTVELLVNAYTSIP
ncbi:MAG: glycosyltransferase [Puniceicoccaceae bacterium]|nr:MAG: glycosyltransferase [Puniceicoccaceae bacterium]